MYVSAAVRWLEFAEENGKSCVEIPPEDAFPPAMSEEVSLLHPLSPRGSVLGGVQAVLLPDSSEEQYASILTACGATTVKIKGFHPFLLLLFFCPSSNQPIHFVFYYILPIHI